MEYTTDVLVIGGGGAACRAALAAADAGARVLLASKRPPAKAGATSYPGGRDGGLQRRRPSGVRRRGKALQRHPGGRPGNGGPAVGCHSGRRGRRQTIRRLEAWGVPFEKEDDGYYVFKSCFSNSPRTHVIRGHGEPIIRAMMRQIALRSQITILDDAVILGLLQNGDGCCGAWGYRTDGTRLTICAGAVVLATGGGSQIFEKNLNPADVTGDGYRMAFEAGAELVNMEFMQIGIGFSHPITNIFNGYIWEENRSAPTHAGQEFPPAALRRDHRRRGDARAPQAFPLFHQRQREIS